MLSFLSGFGTKRPVKPQVVVPDFLDDEAFSVTSDTLTVRDLILRLQKQQCEIRLLPHGGSRTLSTRLTDIGGSFQSLAVAAHDDVLERRLVQESEFLHLCFELGDVPVLLSLNWLAEDYFDDSYHYRLRFPEWAITTQLRSYVRVRLPHDESGALKLLFGAKKMPVVRDISEGGVNILVSGDQLARIEKLKSFCFADLSQEVQVGPTIQLRVRHCTELPSKQFCIGAEFLELNGTQEHALRKILLQEQARSLQKGV